MNDTSAQNKELDVKINTLTDIIMLETLEQALATPVDTQALQTSIQEHFLESALLDKYLAVNAPQGLAQRICEITSPQQSTAHLRAIYSKQALADDITQRPQVQLQTASTAPVANSAHKWLMRSTSAAAIALVAVAAWQALKPTTSVDTLTETIALKDTSETNAIATADVQEKELDTFNNTLASIQEDLLEIALEDEQILITQINLIQDLANMQDTLSWMSEDIR